MAITLLDGGMGQELVHRSGEVPTGLWSTQIMMDRPNLVRAIHDDFFAAGAEIATTNSYAVHRDRLQPNGLDDRFEELHRLACEIACKARDAHGSGKVAGSLGPLGWSYSHDGAPPAEKGAELYDEICRIQKDLVDLFLIETIASVEQVRAALSGTLGHGRPVWLALSVDDGDGTRLRSGEPLEEAVAEIEKRKPDAVLLNCSRPEAVSEGLGILAKTALPFGGYANGFTGISSSFLEKGSAVTKLAARADLGPEEYADHVDAWVGEGATIVGGCCEVSPAHIQELARRHSGS
ncbi:MAG: homocysteine S-methyltransferase family protein [Pseudomonadota bacterium]